MGWLTKERHRSGSLCRIKIGFEDIGHSRIDGKYPDGHPEFVGLKAIINFYYRTIYRGEVKYCITILEGEWKSYRMDWFHYDDLELLDESPTEEHLKLRIIRPDNRLII